MSAWIWVQNSADLFDHYKILKFAKFNPRETVDHPQFAKCSTREIKVFYSTPEPKQCHFGPLLLTLLKLWTYITTHYTDQL